MVRILIPGMAMCAVFVQLGRAASPLDLWTPTSPGTTEDLYTVSWTGKGRFVAVGSRGVTLDSTNGTDWVQNPTGTTNALKGVAWGNGAYVVVGDNGTILRSTDGSNWASASSGSSYPLGGVAFGNGIFVAVGGYWTFDALGILRRYGVILTSPDGTNWKETTPSATGYDYPSIAFGDGQFVVLAEVGNNLRSEEMLCSTNGLDWTYQSLPTSWLASVGFGNDLFVGVGDWGIVCTSADGKTWTQQDSETNAVLYGVAGGNGQFVAVGRAGGIFSSGDGDLWTPRTSGIQGDFYSVAYGDGRFVAVGAAGTVMRSGSTVRLGPVGMLSNGSVKCGVTGPAGQNCPIEASTDFGAWVPLTTVVLTNGSAGFADPSANNFSRRFYRAVVP